MDNPMDGPIHVIVAMDFSDALIEQLRDVSPRLHVERYFPTVPERAWADAEIIYTVSQFPDLTQAPRLRWIQLHSAGFDHVFKQPIHQAEDLEITSTSGIHATVIAEFSLGMMLAFNYRLPLMLKNQANAVWPEKRHLAFTFNELRGQTLGIVGYGSIGQELGRLAKSLGMTVLATKRNLMHLSSDQEAYYEPGTGDAEHEIPRRIYPPEALASMAGECDFLVITAPLTPASRHTINEAVLEAMKSSAVLVNVSRGGLIDEPALISALTAGKIAGAGLDVFEEEPLPTTSPLWNMDNVIISPHVSGNTARYHEKAVALFAENLQRYLEKRPLLNRLNRERGY